MTYYNIDAADTAREAIVKAGLDWEVEKAGGKTVVRDNGEVVPLDSFAIVRTSDNAPLGECQSKYEPIQNAEIFNFLDHFIEQKQICIEGVGVFRDGRKLFVRCPIIGVEGEVVPGDVVSAKLLAYTSHDLSIPLGIQFSDIRGICENSLAAIVKAGKAGKEPSLRIRHTANASKSFDHVKNFIDLNRRTFDVTMEAYRSLTKKKVQIDGVKNYIREILKGEEADDLIIIGNEAEKDTKEKKEPRALDTIMHSYENGPGAQVNGVYGTMWGAMNSFTDYLDHHRGRTDETKQEYSMFGAGRDLRARALQVALDWK